MKKERCRGWDLVHWTFVVAVLSMLAGLELPARAVEVRYLHDADGRRVAREERVTDPISGATLTHQTRYLHDSLAHGGLARPVLEWSQERGSRIMVRGLGLIAEASWNRSAADLSSDHPPSESYYSLPDAHGSVRLWSIASGDGERAGPIQCDAFGQRISPAEPSSENTSRDGSGFVGERWDESVEAYDLAARFYRPELGRFQSRDTLEGSLSEPARLHAYTYTENDPGNLVDPTGHSSLGDLLGSISTRAYLFTQSAGPAATALKTSASLLSIAVMIQHPGEITSGLEGPIAAGDWMMGEMVFAAAYGRRSLRFVSGFVDAKVRVQPVVEEVLGASAARVRELDDEAFVGFRGSVARGYKGNHKGNSPFDSELFDVDGFVVSDRLAEQIPKVNGARFVTRKNMPDLFHEQETIDRELRARLTGLKAQPFNFRVYNYREFQRKLGEARVIE